MSPLTFKYSDMLIAFLPGHKFTIWMGWLIGVMFKSHQSTSARRRRFKILHMAYVVLLNLCILIMIVDWIWNVLPSLSDPNVRFSASEIAAQGLSVLYVTLVVVYRLHLLIIAASLSSFVKNLDDCGTVLLNKPSGFKFWANTLVTVYFSSTALEAIYIAGVVVKLTKDSPWSPVVGNTVLERLRAFVVWQAAVVRFVPFAIAMTTLDRLLDVLESFDKRAKSIIGAASSSRFGKRTMNRESNGQLQSEAYILEIQQLLSEFQKIQELFNRYDQLLGPLIFILLSNSTIGFIDAISEVVQSKVSELARPSSFNKSVALINHLLPFTLLNTGYLAKSRVKDLRISLKREIVAAMSRSRNEGLINLYRNIENWSWEMSAAGFFTVDRSLLTGIASVALNYSVLLFQIQGVFKPGSRADDKSRQQFLGLLTRLNRTFAIKFER